MKRILFAAVYILFCVMGLKAQSPSEQIRENYVQVIKRLKGELTEREQTLQKAYTDLEQMTQKSSIESQNKWIEVLQADIASLKRQIAQTEQRKAQEEANADRLQQELEKRVKEAQQKHRQQQAVQAKQAEAKAAAQRQADYNVAKVKSQRIQQAEEQERKRAFRAEQERLANEREAEAREAFRQRQGTGYQNMHSNIEEHVYMYEELEEKSKAYTTRQSSGYSTIQPGQDKGNSSNIKKTVMLKDIFNDSAKPANDLSKKKRPKLVAPIKYEEYQ